MQTTEKGFSFDIDGAGAFARDSIASLLRGGRVDRAIALVLRTKRRAQTSQPPASSLSVATNDSVGQGVQSFPGEESLLTSLVEDFVHQLRDTQTTSNATRLANAIGTWQDACDGKLPDDARRILINWLFDVGDRASSMSDMVWSWLVSDPSLDFSTWQRYLERQNAEQADQIIANSVAHLAASTEYQREALMLFDLQLPCASRTEELPTFIAACWDALLDAACLILSGSGPIPPLGVVQALRHLLQQWPAWMLVRDTITGLAWWVNDTFPGKAPPNIPLFCVFEAMCADWDDGERVATEARGHITSALLDCQSLLRRHMAAIPSPILRFATSAFPVRALTRERSVSARQAAIDLCSPTIPFAWRLPVIKEALRDADEGVRACAFSLLNDVSWNHLVEAKGADILPTLLRRVHHDSGETPMASHCVANRLGALHRVVHTLTDKTFRGERSSCSVSLLHTVCESLLHPTVCKLKQIVDARPTLLDRLPEYDSHKRAFDSFLKALTLPAGAVNPEVDMLAYTRALAEKLQEWSPFLPRSKILEGIAQQIPSCGGWPTAAAWLPVADVLLQVLDGSVE